MSKTTEKTIKSYSFYSKDLNKGKFNLFVKKAKAIRDYKNAVSLELSSNLLYYMDMSCFDFQKIFGNQKSPLKSSPLLRGNEMQKVSTKVFLSYENMMRRIEQKINFFVQKNIEVEYYKKDTNE